MSLSKDADFISESQDQNRKSATVGLRGRTAQVQRSLELEIVEWHDKLSVCNGCFETVVRKQATNCSRATATRSCRTSEPESQKSKGHSKGRRQGEAVFSVVRNTYTLTHTHTLKPTNLVHRDPQSGGLFALGLVL